MMYNLYKRLGVIFLIFLFNSPIYSQNCTGTSSSTDAYITDVQISGVSIRTSGDDGNNGYTQTGVSTNMIVGDVFTVTTTREGDGTFSYNHSVWFDWNDDGTYEEEYQMGSGQNPNTETSTSITVPASAAGKTISMIAILKFNGYAIDQCDVGSYGEAEDYDIIVAPLCTPPTLGTATVDATNCNMGTFDVSVDVTDLGDGASVDVTDGMGNSQTVSSVPTTVTFTGYAGGTSVTINADNGMCDVDANTVTESCACTTAPTGTAVVNTGSCGSGMFHVDVTVSTLGDAAAVTVSDGTTTDDNGGAGYAMGGTVQMGPYAAGTNVTITLAGLTWTSCSADLAPVTEDCICTTTPTATVTTGNLDCTTNMYDITVTVDSDGSGDANMSDVYIDGVLATGGMNVTTGVANTFTVTLGPHTVTIEAEGSTFSSCTSIDYDTNLSCNGGETCADAVDILGTTSTCDLTNAVNENGSNGGLNPCFETVGNGTTLGMGDCNGAGCAEHSAYWYTDYKDIWYVIDIPDGVDEFSVNFTGLTCDVAVFPYTGTCGSLSLMDVTGGVGTGLADADNDGTIETEANDRPFISSDGAIHFKGDAVATASTASIYLRIFAHDNGASGTACSTADIDHCSFTIGVTSPQPNDVCGDAIDMDNVTASGNLCSANTETENSETGATCAESQDTPDLWYEVTMGSADTDQLLEVDLTFPNATDEVVVELYHNCFTNTFLECATVSSTGANSTVTHAFSSIITEGGFGPTWYVRVTAAAGNSVCDFDILGRRIAENNTCEFNQAAIPGFDIEDANTEMNFSFATPSGAYPTIAGNDLWFNFDPEQSTDATTGLITASTTSEVIIYGDTDVEYTLVLYRGNTVSSNNCTDLEADYLETLTVTPNGNATVELACLDELHLAVDGGYILRVIQTGGPTSTDGLIRTETQPAGPYNNDCENIWNGSGPTILGANGEDATTSFNPYVILPGFSNFRSGDFENSTDCHPDVASAVCNGMDQQAFASNEDRDLWYIVTIPDNTCPSTGLTSSSVINSITFLYNAGDATEDGIIYLYDGCDDSNLIGCSGVLDGAPSGAGDDQFNDPQSTWTATGLTQGESYLVRVKPHDISNNGNNNEFDFDISWIPADPAPCNDDPANAEGLSVGCFSYTDLDTLSAQGATHTAPVDGAGENDVWFSFTAPTGNGGTYTSGTAESWVSVFFENVSGHTLYMDLYNTPSTDAAGRTWQTGSSAGDQAWGVFGNLNEGQTYYIRLYHKELSSVNVEYKIAINDGPGVEPGWACGENSASNISACASGCNDLREVFFKIDLPDGTFGNKYWAIEVTGMDQDLDFELRSKYLNGSTTYVTGTSGPDGAIEGSAADFDHPCSSVALESAVSISSTTTGLTGCDGNDTLGDDDPASSSQASDGDSNAGSGVKRVYFNMNGAVSGQKDYYFLRVFIDPSDPRYSEWTEVKICDISFKGPYSTQALAEAGGTPDENCDPVACDITNVVVSDDDTCDGDDATFTVTFDVSEGGGTYEVFNTDTDAVLGSITAGADATGVSIDITITGPTTGSTINIDVRDQATTTCTGGTPQSVTIATCPNTTVAVDDFINTPEGVAATGNALTNDYDPQGNTQTVTAVTTTDTPSGNGTFSIDAGGNYTYTPDPGFTGEDSFTYTVCDDGTPVVCDMATVHVEVIADPVNGNNPPLADPDYALTEVDVPVTGSLISNDNDPDGDNLVINTTPTSDPTNGSVTINTDGTFTYTPNSGFTGMDMFSYQVCDDGSPSMCDITSVTIDVIPDAGNITSAADDSGVGLVNETITGSLTANDTDPEGDNQNINTTPVSGPGVAGASVTINTDGTYSYVPATDFVGNDQFVYQICDDATPTMACTNATVYITVLPARPNLTYGVTDFNHTPINVAVSGNALSNDSDPEGDNQSVTPVATTDTPSGNGTYTIDAMGNYTYTPDTDFTGEDSFTYQVCDDNSDQACQTVTVYIEVLPELGSTNNGIVANPDYALTEVGTPVIGNITSNDNDPDGDDFVVNTTPEVDPTNGTVTIYPNGSYVYTPNPGFIGTDTFDYEVCDDADPSSCDITTVTIDVIPDNGNTTSAADDSGVGPINQTISGDLLENDTDPEGDSQTVNTTPTSSPSNGSVTIYPDGSYDYVPNTDFVGNDEFTYEVCDNQDPMACKEAKVYLTVLDTKEDPELTVTFSADKFSFVLNEEIDGYFTYINNGLGSSNGPINVVITLPSTSTTTTVIGATTTSVDVAGGTSVNNSDWTLTQVGNLIYAQHTGVIPAGGISRIGMTFTAVGVPLSTSKVISDIIESSAGDVRSDNNNAQGSFTIN